jgi:hypothetical protein
MLKDEEIWQRKNFPYFWTKINGHLIRKYAQNTILQACDG